MLVTFLFDFSTFAKYQKQQKYKIEIHKAFCAGHPLKSLRDYIK